MLRRTIIDFNDEFGFSATLIFPSWDLNHYGDLSGKKGTLAVIIDNNGRLLHFDISSNP